MKILRTIFWGLVSLICPQMGLEEIKLKIPCNLDEAVLALGETLSPEDEEYFKDWSEEKFVPSLHHNIGRWVRNNWGLWDEKSKLHKWFKAIGIWHADDMSGIILTSYYRKTHNLPIRLREQIQHYVEYWQVQEEDDVFTFVENK